VLALELGDDALDRALHPERLVAADTVERLLLLEHARAGGGGAEIELRPQGDHLLRAGRLAQSALHAGVFRKSQHRPFGIVAERAGRTGRHAGEAQRAALDVDLDRAKRRARGQRDDIDRSRRRALQFPQREPHDVAFAADRQEARRSRHTVRRLDCAQRLAERIGIVGLDRRRALPAEAEPGEDRLRERERLGEA
jgi:hypothetical protein